jgi:hypothetical protein
VDLRYVGHAKPLPLPDLCHSHDWSPIAAAPGQSTLAGVLAGVAFLAMTVILTVPQEVAGGWACSAWRCEGQRRPLAHLLAAEQIPDPESSAPWADSACATAPSEQVIRCCAAWVGLRCLLRSFPHPRSTGRILGGRNTREPR